MKRPIAGSSTLTSRQPYVACRKLADRGRSKKFVGRVRIDDPPRRLFASISVAGAKVNAARHTGQNLQTTWYNKPMPLRDCAPRPAHIKWLLDSDPAIRWQVMRDLTGEAPDAISAERSRVATEGWGAQLLALQSPAGKWGGSPRGWRDDLPKEDRGLLITFYALVVLKDLGLDPSSKQARKMVDRVEQR